LTTEFERAQNSSGGGDTVSQFQNSRKERNLKFVSGVEDTMNRRQLLCAAAAGAAMFARVRTVRAATFDLLIKGGRVIDPSVGLDGVRDVGIAGGRIVAMESSITGDAADTIDARGKIVAPGLIDIHTHAGRGKGWPA